MGLSGRKTKQRIPDDPRNLAWANGAPARHACGHSNVANGSLHGFLSVIMAHETLYAARSHNSTPIGTKERKQSSEQAASLSPLLVFVVLAYYEKEAVAKMAGADVLLEW